MKLFKQKFFPQHWVYLLYFILAVGVFLRLYNFAWGAPYFFHPDERNIASAVVRISPENLNPEFFAYGSLPIYIIYGVGVVVNALLSFWSVGDVFSVSFENAILISRVMSALFSVGLVVMLFKLRPFLSTFSFWVTFVLSAFSVGYIQYAHFGTFEMWLAFFGFLMFYFLLLYFGSRKVKHYLLACVAFGVLMSVKVSSVVLFPALLVPVVFLVLKEKEGWLSKIFRIGLFAFGGIFISAAIFLVSNPFFVLDNASYISSLVYESSVASGTLPVFYTGRFFETIPVVFHFWRVFPFLINPLNTFVLVVGVVFCVFRIIKKRDFLSFFVLVFFLLLFVPQAFLFVKWNRYMVPTLPFVYLIIAMGSETLLSFFSKRYFPAAAKIFVTTVTVCAVVFSLAFFATVHLKNDTRVEAYLWAKENIRPSAPILSEVYDLGVVPFEKNFSNIELVNSYEFENGESLPDLGEYEYFLMPSARIMRSRLVLGEHFPKGEAFYSSLVDGSAGYELVYKTPCDALCKISYLGDPVFRLEETANVFDRPTVAIYENKKN